MNSQATHRGVAHWDVLSVTKDAVAERKNAQTTIAGLRSIFGSYDWLIREAIHVTKYLLDAMVTCKFCYQTGATRGVFDTNPATIKAHEPLRHTLRLFWRELRASRILARLASWWRPRLSVN